MNRSLQYPALPDSLRFRPIPLSVLLPYLRLYLLPLSVLLPALLPLLYPLPLCPELLP